MHGIVHLKYIARKQQAETCSLVQEDIDNDDCAQSMKTSTPGKTVHTHANTLTHTKQGVCYQINRLAVSDWVEEIKPISLPKRVGGVARGGVQKHNKKPSRSVRGSMFKLIMTVLKSLHFSLLQNRRVRYRSLFAHPLQTFRIVLIQPTQSNDTVYMNAYSQHCTALNANH